MASLVLGHHNATTKPVGSLANLAFLNESSIVMLRIESKVYTVLENGTGRHDVDTVAKDAGCRIDSYETLVDVVADLAYHNWRYTLLFRGQHADHPAGGPSTLFPSLWRLRGKPRRKRALEELKTKSESLLKLRSIKHRDRKRLGMLPERSWAILQHYSDVAECETPLFDVTESVRVAASMATQGYLKKTHNKNSHGVVFVLGLPTIEQGTTVSVDDGLVMLRLSSVCPQAARRPHFQSGYLVGSYPLEKIGYKPNKDFARRLIAKLNVSTDDASFWNVDSPLDESALFPDDHALRDEIAAM